MHFCLPKGTTLRAFEAFSTKLASDHEWRLMLA